MFLVTTDWLLQNEYTFILVLIIMKVNSCI